MEQPVIFKSELSDKHNLFKTLAENPPRWWSMVKNHPELYIEVRKGNYINIYYKGGSIAKVEYDDKSDKLSVVTHPKYLGRTNYDDETCYYPTERNGRLVDVPIYQNCEDWLESRLEDMLSNVDKHYDSKEKQEQARMILSDRTKYLDSEFEHLYKRYEMPDKKDKNDFMRIDLVELRNNTIRFVELKMIGDGRLLKKGEDELPEIFDQMQKYRDFAEKYKDDLRKYYQLLYRIKKELLKLPVADTDIELLEIEPKPVLVIANDYDRETIGRTQRIKNINKKMIQRNDVFDFASLTEENYANNNS